MIQEDAHHRLVSEQVKPAVAVSPPGELEGFIFGLFLRSALDISPLEPSLAAERRDDDPERIHDPLAETTPLAP